MASNDCSFLQTKKMFLFCCVCMCVFGAFVIRFFFVQSVATANLHAMMVCVFLMLTNATLTMIVLMVKMSGTAHQLRYQPNTRVQMNMHKKN